MGCVCVWHGAISPARCDSTVDRGHGQDSGSGDYLLSFVEHFPSRPQPLPRAGWKELGQRGGGDPDRLGGERLAPVLPPQCSCREGEELMERWKEEQLRGEALELRWAGGGAPCDDALTRAGPRTLGMPPLPCTSWARQLRISASLALLARTR